MRKLLQNKAVVSALAVVAAVAVTANFVSFPKLLGVTAAARSSAEPATPPAETPVRMPPTSRLADEQKLWRELFPVSTGVRDPFASPANISLPSAHAATTPENSSSTPRFLLQAISCEPDRAYAVINQQVVARGDRLSGHTVERILPGSVELRGPAGLVSLTFPQAAARQKAPTGKPAPADLPAAAPRSSPPESPR